MANKRPSRDEYQRVREEKPKIESAENEIRVTAAHGQHSYISYAIAVLNGEDGKAKNDTVKISGMGGAIFNAVNIAEIVKRRVAGLHQVTEINSEIVKDEYEPKDRSQNPDNVVVERKVSTILITLSRQQLDKSNVGYQEPIPEDQVTEQEERDPGVRRGSGRGGRGGRGSGRGGRGGRGGRNGGRSGGRGAGRSNGAGRGGAPVSAAGAPVAAGAAGAVDRRDARE